MKFLLILLFALTTPPEFKWKYEGDDYNINMKSIYDLSAAQQSKLFYIYFKSDILYFKSHSRETCHFSKLTIEIISPKMMNDRKKFDDVDIKEVFGRYYWKYNILYITEEAFTNPEYLSHELFHYFNEQCGIFNGVDEEEKEAYKFQDLYLRLHGH